MEASPLGAPELAAPSHIGERLREARNRNGMTVREIARRVGVSPSLISQIERDKVNPSVSTLWALVTVLGLTMGDLFSEAEQRSGAAAATPARPAGPVTVPGGRAVINLETGVHWERLTAGSDSVVEFLSVTYPPGAASCGEHSLVSHGGKEYGYVVSGRLGVRIGFDEFELEPGMAISFDASAPHRLWAIGDRPAEAIWVVVGRQSDSRGPMI
ncbi:MAG TPA: helix-turn-helix domain-containing protein [Gaiellaceae bacterium]|jgi:transcriptional regulator with XRE-family HTH domain